MHNYLLAIVLLVGCHAFAQAQKDYNIYLASDTLQTKKLPNPEDLSPGDLQLATFGAHHYVIVQFTELPSAEERRRLRERGVQLLDYLPNYAFFARLPASFNFKDAGFRKVIPPAPRHKFGGALAAGELPGYALQDDGWRLAAVPFQGITTAQLAADLSEKEIPILKQGAGAIEVLIPQDRLEWLAAHPAIRLLEPAAPPPFPEGMRGRTLGRLNLLSEGPLLGYDGSGVTLAIADDGGVNHIDFTGRLTDFTAGQGGNHGDMTAGLAIGAGNLHPLGIGMAPGSHLFLYGINGYPHLQEAVNNYVNDRVVITSTSFSEGCGGWYSFSAQSLDNQIQAVPFLFHCFSAGNSALESCSTLYGDVVGPNGQRYGNLTGGMKVAKHTLAVGNVYYNDSLQVNSSHGPTIDGRIKPDICALGQGGIATGPDQTYSLGSGTSAASPTVAGALASLTQAYRETNNDEDPPLPLLKPILLNTAEDLGRPGPDYEFGWGRINAVRALESIEEHQHFSGTVVHGSSSAHFLHVPAGVKELRVMAYWNDPAGSPNAAQALVNDLDLTLQTPGGSLLRPWVLSTAPHIDSLTRPAWRGVDRKNNMEQITLTNPAPGNHLLRVHGHLVPQGPQDYFLVYYFVTDDLQLTYPAGEEAFVPGETETIRWDAFGDEGTFSLAYALDTPGAWIPISNAIDGHLRHFDWEVPGYNGRKLFFRIQRNSQSAVTSQGVTVIATPEFEFAYLNDTTALISWAPVTGADRYDVFRLGDQYMEVIDSTEGTSLPFAIGLWEEAWLSVRARYTDDLTGRRAVAQKYRHLPCEAQVTLTLNFDHYPGETHWEIKDDGGEILTAGGPYTGQAINSTLEEQFCLPAGCFTLYVYDLYGDGMCCENGDGWFQLTDGTGSVLAWGGSFTSVSINNFCLAPGVTSLTLATTSVMDASCSGAQDGSATVMAGGGTGNYTFSWSNGQSGPSASGLAAGVYTVTVNDGTNALSTTIVIDQPPPLQVAVTVQSGNCTDGSATATATVTGGSAPYIYLWSNGQSGGASTLVGNGSQWIFITDANECTTIAFFTVDEPDILSLNLTSTPPACHDDNNGAVTAQAAGGTPPYTFNWSTGATTTSISALSTGTYNVTVTDANGCQISGSTSLAVPTAITLSLAAGNNSGSIDLTVSGGTGPFTFQWSDGTTQEDPSGLAAGTYTVTVTDANGCAQTASWTISEVASATGYCDASAASTSFEWIESIQIGENVYDSGNDDGYGDHTGYAFTATPGDTVAIVLTPGFAANTFSEYWRVWIDLNQDEDFFDEGELVLATGSRFGTVTETLVLPAGALTGPTRLRVSMKYGSAPPACGDFGYGEVEDYTIIFAPADNGGGGYTGDYCDSGSQSSTFEWIESVSLGNVTNLSGNNGGYADFTGGPTIEATAGQALPFTLIPGFQSNYFGETWRMWIDYNQDGDFEDPGELVFASTQSNVEIAGTINIPGNATVGFTRLRVTMKWGGQAEPCESYNWGETEDYNLHLSPIGENLAASGGGPAAVLTTGSSATGPDFREDAYLFPNPAYHSTTLFFQSDKEQVIQVVWLDNRGRLIRREQFSALAGNNQWEVSTGDLPAGFYYVRVNGRSDSRTLKLIVR